MTVLITVRVGLQVNLAQFLDREVKQSSLRAVEAKTGVSKTAIRNIITGQTKETPEIETLRRISGGYNIPFWRVLQMADVDLGLTNPDGSPFTPEQMAVIDSIVTTTTPEEYARFLREFQRELQRDPEVLNAVWNFLRGRRSTLPDDDGPRSVPDQ